MEDITLQTGPGITVPVDLEAPTIEIVYLPMVRDMEILVVIQVREAVHHQLVQIEVAEAVVIRAEAEQDLTILRVVIAVTAQEIIQEVEVAVAVIILQEEAEVVIVQVEVDPAVVALIPVEADQVEAADLIRAEADLVEVDLAEADDKILMSIN